MKGPSSRTKADKVSGDRPSFLVVDLVALNLVVASWDRSPARPERQQIGLNPVKLCMILVSQTVANHYAQHTMEPQASGHSWGVSMDKR